MHYKPIENCHEENAILGKDFNLGVTNSFFHAFTQRYHPLLEDFDPQYTIICISWFQVMKSLSILKTFSCPKHLGDIGGNTCGGLGYCQQTWYCC
jgi:hypothetical protein